jgi:predicted transcriptional regulator
MKRITLRADPELIERAREVARARHATLNQLFRDWLVTLIEQQDRDRRVSELEVRLGYANAGRRFTREEMNER